MYKLLFSCSLAYKFSCVQVFLCTSCCSLVPFYAGCYSPVHIILLCTSYCALVYKFYCLQVAILVCTTSLAHKLLCSCSLLYELLFSWVQVAVLLFSSVQVAVLLYASCRSPVHKFPFSCIQVDVPLCTS